MESLSLPEVIQLVELQLYVIVLVFQNITLRLLFFLNSLRCPHKFKKIVIHFSLIYLCFKIFIFPLFF